MGLMDTVRRLLGAVEGHEDEVAEQVGKRTGVSEEKAKEGITKAQDAVGEGSNGDTGTENRN